MNKLRRSRSRVAKWLVPVGILALLLLRFGESPVMRDPAATASPEPAEKPEPARLPQASKELAARLAWTIKNSPSYDFAKAVKIKPLRKQADAWQAQWRSKIELLTERYVDCLASEVPPARVLTLVGGSKASLRKSDRGPGYVLRHEDKDGKVTLYQLLPEQLAEVDFESVQAMQLFHPAQTPVPSYSVRNQPIATVVEQLCAPAYLSFALRADAEGQYRVSLSLYKKPATDCLAYAAKAAGMTATYWQEPPPGSRSLGGPMVSIRELPSLRFDVQAEIRDRMQKYKDSIKGRDPTEAELTQQAMAHIGQLFVAKAQRWLGNRSVVVMLDPIAETK